MQWIAVALGAAALGGVTAARVQEGPAASHPSADIEAKAAECAALRNAPADSEPAIALARDVGPLVARLWSAQDGGAAVLPVPDGVRLLEIAAFRIQRLGSEQPQLIADEFARVWKRMEEAPLWQLDSAANLAAWLELRSRWLPELDSFARRLDAEQRAKLGALIRATPIAGEAARAFEAEAERVDRALRVALLERGGAEDPKGVARRVQSVRLLEEDGFLVGVVVVLDDGRELALRESTEVGGARLESFRGGSFEPVASVSIDGVTLRCYPRSGIVRAPWPTATRRAWVQARFGAEGSGPFENVRWQAQSRLLNSPTYGSILERVRAAASNLDAPAEFSHDELSSIVETVHEIERARLQREFQESGAAWDDEDFLDTSGVTDPIAPVAAAWVGGQTVIAGSAEFEERAWLSLAWIMGLPAADREMALGWVRGEVQREQRTYLLHLAAPSGIEVPKLPDLEALVAAVVRLESRIAYVAAGLDGGAPEEDHSALLLRIMPMVHELTEGPDRGRLPEEARPPAPQGVPADLEPYLVGWLREDPNPSEARHQRFAASLEPLVRVLETIGGGDSLDVVQTWRAEDNAARSTRVSRVTDVFDLMAFRIGYSLSTSDVAAGVEEFATAWTALPKALGPTLASTVEQRDFARRALLRPVLRHRQDLSPEQRGRIRALLDATDAWAETAELCEVEAHARCIAVRERIAAAAGTSTTVRAFENGTITALGAQLRDGNIVGVSLNLSDGSEVVLEPGQESHGVTLLDITDSWLDPIARMRCGGETFLVFPLTAIGYADWPRLPRSAWLDVRYGNPSSAARKHMDITRYHALSVAPQRFEPEFWYRIEPPLRDISVESDLTLDDVDRIVDTGAHGGVFVEFDGPEVVAWLAPRLVVAGEVDAEERFWQTFARICRFEDASLREESLGYLEGQWASVRKPWMRANPTPSPRVDSARARAFVLAKATELFAE